MLVLAAFRFYKGIFLHVGPKDRISYLRSPKNWEFMGLLLLICIQTWLGDILVVSENATSFQSRALSKH